MKHLNQKLVSVMMPLKWPKLFTFWRLVTFANIFWDLATVQRRGSKFSQTKLMFFSSQRILKLIKKWRLTLVFVFKRRLIVDDCYFWLYFGKQSIGCMNLDEITSHSLRWYMRFFDPHSKKMCHCTLCQYFWQYST